MNTAELPLMPPAGKASSSVTLEWLDDGAIPVLTIRDVARGTIDIWFKLLVDIMKAWPADRPFVIMHHIDTQDAFLSPYIRSRVKDLDKVNADLNGRVALVLPRTFVAQIARIFLRTARRTGVMTEIFFKREEGLAWLEKLLRK